MHSRCFDGYIIFMAKKNNQLDLFKVYSEPANVVKDEVIISPQLLAEYDRRFNLFTKRMSNGCNNEEKEILFNNDTMHLIRII